MSLAVALPDGWWLTFGNAMAFKPFNIPQAKSKPVRAGEAVDVAARYLVYKLYVPGPSIAGAWQPLSMLGESAATVGRAVERGWVIVREEGHGKTKKRYAALTDEGRLLARKALR